MHLHAIIAIIGGIYRSHNAETETLAVALMTQYILYAIVFELIAINVQLTKFGDNNNSSNNNGSSKKKKGKRNRSSEHKSSEKKKDAE
jgi:hypothetical protein